MYSHTHTHTHIHIYICIKSKLTIVVESELKVHFSLATTPCSRESDTPFLGLLHFTLDPYLITLSAKQGCIKYHFLSLCST